MAEESSEIQLTSRELKLVLKYGYPFPEHEEQLRNSSIKNGMHVVNIAPYWISMWIADIVRSARKIRSHGLLEELNALCDVLETAERQASGTHARKT